MPPHPQMQKWTLLVYKVITLLFWTSWGYPNGTNSLDSNSIKSFNESFDLLHSGIPYNISVSQRTFNPHDEITVMLQVTNNTEFKGFLLQAQGPDGTVPYGSFRITDRNTRGLSNGNTENSLVSHKDSNNKKLVQTTWIAPPESGNIQFRATVFQDLDEPGVNIKSQTLQALTRSFKALQSMNSRDCGKSKFCFRSPAKCDPTDTNCLFMSLEFLGNQSFRCEMSGLSAGYVAIGFSTDTLMGNDDVYICLLNDNGEVVVQYGYTTGRRPPTINPLGEVRNIETSFINGVIKCSFITSNPISIEQNNSDNLYYIFLALGPTQNGSIRKHTTTPLVTTQKVDIFKPIDASGTSSPTPVLIKVHGSIMLISWMVIGNVGMVFARFWKGVMVKQVLGKELWFQVHRSLMTLTVVFVMIAFILPFIHVQGWSGNWPHPILGCIVMVLAFLQPVIALFRPPPHHKRRIIFNWFHAVTAFALRILSDVTMLLGFKIIDPSPDIWMEKVMGGLVGWGILRDVIFHANAYFWRKDGDENPKGKIKNEKILLIVYMCGNFIFIITLLVGIGQS
ncbi:putative ferric-chelate reductase 1 isoform X1 [Monodelphis domestica]|uniref:putative ferric-chelate reductase 1 isoform X1 n=2 Tax=Monodelphis domestica TaxID=13616 RepID=UPI00028BD6F8|nr:putative ferric-chelate reductase 1 isoform X1 [Monodelphis domestica]